MEKKIMLDELDLISLYLFALSFKRNFNGHISREFSPYLNLVPFKKKTGRLKDF